MNPIDEKIQTLLDLGTSLFIEFYSHTNSYMYKCLNPYTEYKEEKLVLNKVEEGIENSLDLAIEQIKIKKINYE